MAVGRAGLWLTDPSALGLRAPRVCALCTAPSGRTGGPGLIPTSLGGPVAQSDANIFVSWLSLRNDLTFKSRMSLYLSKSSSYWCSLCVCVYFPSCEKQMFQSGC